MAEPSPFHRGNPAANTDGVHHATQTHPPTAAALLIGMLLAGSAGVVYAQGTGPVIHNKIVSAQQQTPTQTSQQTTRQQSSYGDAESLTTYMVDQVKCAYGNLNACQALKDAALGMVSPDTATNPTIQNKSN